MSDRTKTPPAPEGLNLGISKQPGGGFTWVLRDGETPRVQGLLVAPTKAAAMSDALSCCSHVIETLASQYIDLVHQQESSEAAEALNRANAAMPSANLTAVPDVPRAE